MSPNMGFGPVQSNYYGHDDQDKSKKKKLIIFGAAILFIILIFIWIIFGNRTDPAQATLVSLARSQQETLEISENFGKKDLNKRTTINFNAELYVALSTLNQDTQAELTRLYGIKSVKSSPNAQTTQLLEDATTLGKIDAEYSQVVAEQLANQVRLAQQAQGELTSEQARQKLGDVATKTATLRERIVRQID